MQTKNSKLNIWEPGVARHFSYNGGARFGGWSSRRADLTAMFQRRT